MSWSRARGLLVRALVAVGVSLCDLLLRLEEDEEEAPGARVDREVEVLDEEDEDAWGRLDPDPDPDPDPLLAWTTVVTEPDGEGLWYSLLRSLPERVLWLRSGLTLRSCIPEVMNSISLARAAGSLLDGYSMAVEGVLAELLLAPCCS